jgi:GntR family transcriptional regulator, N-acetylglucosamine utilization regulator
MVFDRIASSNEGPVEQTISRYRGDRYQLSMSLQRGPSTR